jgi:plasmid stabilization system protein ParE
VDHNAPDAAFRFLEAVETTIGRIAEMPGIGTPKVFKNPLLAGLRSFPVDEFENIHVYYLADRKGLRVVRVLHGPRDIGTILANEMDDDDSFN